LIQKTNSETKAEFNLSVSSNNPERNPKKNPSYWLSYVQNPRKVIENFLEPISGQNKVVRYKVTVQEDCRSSPAWANSSWDAISKIIRAKWSGVSAQTLVRLLCKCKALNSNPSLTKQTKKNYIVGDMSNLTRSQLERVPNGQSWNNLSNKNQ
jgi:hypothetical protein